MRSSLQATLLFVFAFFAAPALAESPRTAAQTAVIAAVEHHVTEIDAGDVAAMKADLAPESAIVDGFAPFLWQSADPLTPWWTGMHDGMKAAGLDKLVTTLHGWKQVNVAGDHAFVVADCVSVISGPKLALRANDLLSATLVLENGKWLITSWTYAGADLSIIKKS